MDLDKLENKLKKKNIKYKIGLLGGTFDPPHKGHVKISLEAKKKYKLNYVIWSITKKNPFKNKSLNSLKKRIELAKKINKTNPFIKVKYLEDKVGSNKTFDLISYLKNKNKNHDIYFIMGADNLIKLHKWYKWQQILKKFNILVFDRNKYKSKSLKSVAYKKFRKKGLDYINFKKINISSSKLRKIW
tara:strand:- start:217 stop:777 length:561 start_codon:yes stop_codon:yes gene_type:complete